MDELKETEKKKYKVIRIVVQAVILALFIGLIVFLTIKLYPIFKAIQRDEAYREAFINKISSYGGLSIFIVTACQILQTILVIIPSGPIVMVAGMLFHPAVAVIVCLIGQTIGGIIVYYLVKLLGYNFVALFIDPDKIKCSKILKNKTRCNVVMFGYLLIPALPKDIVCFVAPFTNIKIHEFICITFFARIPMTIVTVILGSSLIHGSYILAIVLASLSLALAIICFIFNKRISAIIEK